MGRFFRRMWKYLGASANSKFDEKADPRIQIEQAVEEAQKRHQSLTQQAASVIGNQRQLEMKLARQQDEVAKLQASARQAIVLADQARAGGDEAKASQYEATAQTFASNLVSSEQALEDLKTLHTQSAAASAQGQADGGAERPATAALPGGADEAADPARVSQDAGNRVEAAGRGLPARRPR